MDRLEGIAAQSNGRGQGQLGTQQPSDTDAFLAESRQCYRAQTRQLAGSDPLPWIAHNGSSLTSGSAQLVADGDNVGGLEHQAIADPLKRLEHHQLTGTLGRQRENLATDGVFDLLAFLVDGEHMARLDAIRGTKAQRHGVKLTYLGNAAQDIDDHRIRQVGTGLGVEHRLNAFFAAGEEAIQLAHLFTTAAQIQRQDIFVLSRNPRIRHLVQLEAQEFTGYRMVIFPCRTIEALNTNIFIDGCAAGIDTIACAGNDAFVTATDHVGRRIKHILIRHDIVIQEAGNITQGNRRNRLLQRLHSHLRAELANATLETEPWPAVDPGQIYNITGVNKMGVIDLRVYIPHFGPAPGALQKAPRDVPEGISLDHYILSRVPILELYPVGTFRSGRDARP